MRDINFSATAKELMQSPLFSVGSRKGSIEWSEQMIEMWLRCECQCVYCGRSMLDTYVVLEFDAQLDHLLPKGEYPELKNEPSNWALACSACNKLKGTWDANVYGGEPLYVKGSGSPISRADQKEFIRRVIDVNDRYSRTYEDTFSKQKQMLLSVLAASPAGAGIEQAKAAHDC